MVERVLFDSRPADRARVSKIHVKYILFITYFPYAYNTRKDTAFMYRTRSRDRVGSGTIVFRRNNIGRRPHVDPIVPPSTFVCPPCTVLLLLLLLYFAQSVFVPVLCLYKNGRGPYTVACDLTRTRGRQELWAPPEKVRGRAFVFAGRR